MKNIIKLLSAFVVMAAAIACDKSQEGPIFDATNVDSTIAYFVAKTRTAEFAGDATGTQTIDVELHRHNGKGSVTVALDVKADADAANFFSVPASATFEDGACVTTIPVQLLNVENFEKGVKYSAVISVPEKTSETLDTQRNFSMTVTASAALEYNLLGIGQYTDDLVGSLFGADPITYDVEVYSVSGLDGFIYLKNAYTSEFPYNDPGDYVEDDVYFVIDARVPDKVVIPEQALGVDWGYGMMYIYGTMAYGTYANGVVTFPARGIAIADDDGAYYGCPNGAFKLVMPK